MTLTNLSKKADIVTSPVIQLLIKELVKRTNRIWIAEEFTKVSCFSTRKMYYLLRKVEKPTGDLDWELVTDLMNEYDFTNWICVYLKHLEK